VTGDREQDFSLSVYNVLPMRLFFPLVVLLCCSLVHGSQPEASSPAEQFRAAFREWNTLEAELTKRQKEYEAAPAATRGELKKQYEQLVEQSTELLSKLSAAAEAAYVAQPNQDKDVTRTLIGVLVFHYRQDEYD
jgi:hypothetical protein